MNQETAHTLSASAATIKPTDLRGILKYVPRFRNQIFVIAVDGSIVADDNFPNLLVDIAVLRSLAIKVVLVHGISVQLEELSELRHIPITNADGTEVTDAATLDLAVRCSSRVSHQILEGLTHSSLKCVITNAVRALPVGVIKGIDQEFTGRVDRIDKAFVEHLLAQDIVPIIQPIGFGPEGRTLRINSDHLAAALAESLNATKILFLTDQPGLVLDDELLRQISVDELKRALADTTRSFVPKVRSKAQHAVRAVEQGTPRVHVLDGRVFDGLLNEIFSNEGVGSLIYGNDYQQIRRATKRDARFIYNLTRNGVKRAELINRSQPSIEKQIDHYYVFEIDENIIACVTLYFFDDRPEIAEVGSLYVLPYYHGRGIGRKMIDFACMQAKTRGAKTIVALSTQSATFFTSACNFVESEKSILPEARLKQYEQNGRNPKVLVRTLD